MSSSAHVGVCLLLVLAQCAVYVNAIDKCNDYLIKKVGHDDCRGGIIPPQEVVGQHRVMRVLSSRADVPEDAFCIANLFQYEDTSSGYIGFEKNGKKWYKDQPVLTQVVFKDFVKEYGPNDEEYRIYVIHNEYHVYTFYKCIETGAEGDGHPMVATYIGCNFGMHMYNSFTKTPNTIEDAKLCFKAMGIPDYEIVQLGSCPCAV